MRSLLLVCLSSSAVFAGPAPKKPPPNEIEATLLGPVSRMSDGTKLGDQEDRAYLAKLRDPKVLDPILACAPKGEHFVHVVLFLDRETKVDVIGKEDPKLASCVIDAMKPVRGTDALVQVQLIIAPDATAYAGGRNAGRTR
jgi:hypothetical protein